MLNSEPRTERSHGLRANLNEGERQGLFNLVQMPGYETLLDIMERACIQQETKLINADASDEVHVLAEHKMSKAFWQVFIAVQKEVQYQVNEFLGTRDPIAELAEEDRILGTE